MNPNISQIRKDFPILSTIVNEKQLVYLDNAATSQKPIQVINKLTDYYKNTNSNVHRGVHTLSGKATDEFEDVRLKVAKFINAPNYKQMNPIIWTRNTRESINIISMTWANDNLEENDEIVVTAMEHHSNLIPWQRLCKRKKAKLKIFPINNNQELDLKYLDEYINSNTKLISIVHSSNSMGTINPIKTLIKKAKSVNAKVLIDGAQSVPHMPVDVTDLDCDFLVFSAHKMLGPTGLGILYVKKDILQNLEPHFLGGEMVLDVSYESATWNDIPMKFEAGTPNIADVIAFGSAIDYLNDIGMSKIREHESELTAFALNILDENKYLKNNSTLFGPKNILNRSGVLTFHSDIAHPHDLGTLLDNEGIAVRTGHHCTMPLMKSLGVPATLRASFYIYNTEEEITKFFECYSKSLRFFDNVR